MTHRETFYQHIADALTQPPHERHRRLAELHTQVVAGYCGAVQAITAEAAAGPSADGRTLAQVIGHIAEWDRYAILSAGEMLAGAEWPCLMTFSRFIEPDGTLRSFKSVHEFNAQQAERHAQWPWERIRDLAIQSATAIQILFTHPALLTPELLERTKPYTWTMNETIRQTLPVGWYLWFITIEHQAVEHTDEVGWAYGD